MKTTHLHVLESDDGWKLHLEEWSPAGDVVATVFMGHAMMADRRSLMREDKPCIAQVLVASGFRVIAGDARGHGASGPTAQDGGSWTYNALVEDTGVIWRWVQKEYSGTPTFFLGHSLFGHTSLAWLGRNPECGLDGFVGVGVNIWCKKWESNPLRWKKKVAIKTLMKFLSFLWGRFPARTLGVGKMDEPIAYLRHFYEAVESDHWCDEEGRGYYEELAKTKFPILHVLSAGDALIGDPQSSSNFLEIVAERKETLLLDKNQSDRGLQGLMPGHMEIITSPDSAPIWNAIGDWLLARAQAVADEQKSC